MFRTFLSQLLRNPVYAQADLELYEFFKSQGAATVSYTHLDVYKRQDILWAWSARMVLAKQRQSNWFWICSSAPVAQSKWWADDEGYEEDAYVNEDEEPDIAEDDETEDEEN